MRHLKILGLALVAVLAMSAVASAAASAASFSSEGNVPVSIDQRGPSMAAFGYVIV